jgi:hypothetical protein
MRHATFLERRRQTCLPIRPSRLSTGPSCTRATRINGQIKPRSPHLPKRRRPSFASSAQSAGERRMGSPDRPLHDPETFASLSDDPAVQPACTCRLTCRAHAAARSERRQGGPEPLGLWADIQAQNLASAVAVDAAQHDSNRRSAGLSRRWRRSAEYGQYWLLDTSPSPGLSLNRAGPPAPGRLAPWLCGAEAGK